jgi:hypothetical protein
MELQSGPFSLEVDGECDEFPGGMVFVREMLVGRGGGRSQDGLKLCEGGFFGFFGFFRVEF